MEDYNEWKNVMDTMYQEGFAKGFAQGFAQGLEKGQRITIAANMKRAGMDPQLIAQVTELSEDEISKIEYFYNRNVSRK